FHVADFSTRTRLWIEFVAAATRDEELRNLLDEVFLAWKQVVRRIVEAGIADGSFAPQLDAEIAIDALLAQLDGFEIAHATGAVGPRPFGGHERVDRPHCRSLTGAVRTHLPPQTSID